MGKSVGLEILGRLLYCAYDQKNYFFDAEKISQIALLDWSIGSRLWDGNIVRLDPNPKNAAKPYRITASASPIKIAVNVAKASLGWM